MSKLWSACKKADEKADQYDDIYWPHEEVIEEVKRLLGNPPHDVDLDEAVDFLDDHPEIDTGALQALIDRYVESGI